MADPITGAPIVDSNGQTRAAGTVKSQSLKARTTRELRFIIPTKAIPIAWTLSILLVINLAVAGPNSFRPLATLCLFLVIPALLVGSRVSWPASLPLLDRSLVTIAVVLAGQLWCGLLLNIVGRWIGIERPLDPGPSAISVGLVCVGLSWARRDVELQCWRQLQSHYSFFGPKSRAAIWASRAVPAAASACMGGSIIGAFRLNNGESGNLSTLVLGALVAMMAVVVLTARYVSDRSIAASIYLIAVAQLLMSSLRGWFVSGHDIHRELQVFALTTSNGYWDPDVFRNTYNACLSLTIFPTMIAGTAGVEGLVVYKVVFPMLFALCPVVVFAIARRITDSGPAALASVIVMGFPTFMADMPYLNRQALAFVFVAVLALIVIGRDFEPRITGLLILYFGTGVLLSHYSTTYVLILVLGFALVVQIPLQLIDKWRGASGADRLSNELHSDNPIGKRRFVIGAITVLGLVGATALWAGPITGTGSGATQTIKTAVTAITSGSDLQSGDTSFSLVGGGEKKTPQQQVDRFREYSVDEIRDDGGFALEESPNSEYYPLTLVDKFPITAYDYASVPFTPIGRTLALGDPDPQWLVNGLRTIGAGSFQLLLMLGLLLCVFAPSVRRRISAEMLTLAAGSVFAIGMIVAIPALSIEYGVFRGFLQGLLVFAPIMAIGAVWALRRVTRFALPGATVLVVGVIAVMTGLVPQLIGGFQPLMYLNNSGRYFDTYYNHAADVSALRWASERVEPGQDIQYDATTAKYSALRTDKITDAYTSSSAFPTIVRRNSYVVVGTTTVRGGLMPLFYGGDLGAYHYPLAFLDEAKSRVYDNGDARVYQ